MKLSNKKFQKIDFTPQIDISFSNDNKILTISDNGIGMNKADLKDHNISDEEIRNKMDELNEKAKSEFE